MKLVETVWACTRCDVQLLHVEVMPPEDDPWGLPDGWQDCPECGAVMIASRKPAR